MNIKETTQSLLKGLYKPENIKSLVPNWLSFSRAIGGVAIPTMINNNAQLSLVIPVISFVAISDYLDGKIARLLKAESKEGALLDVVSDKIFSMSLIAGISSQIPTLALNGILEGYISYINAKSLTNGGDPKSNMLGKIKIWPLSVSLGLGYIAATIKNKDPKNPNIDNIFLASKVLSLLTIPLELINIKQYQDEANKQAKTKDKKQNGFSLNKKNNKVIVFEHKLEKEKTKEKQKRL